MKGGIRLDTLEKIKKLTDKQNGVGISKTIIGRYCGQHFNSITYYLNGAKPSQEVLEQYENGLHKLLDDIQEIIED